MTDPSTGAPLLGVRVMVRGTALGAFTNAQGQYSIRNIPAGQYDVNATLIGRAPGSQQVTLAAGAAVTVNFQLAQTALTLEGLVVTATGEQQRAREVGVAVGKVNVDEQVELAAVNDVSDVLQGRVAGVSVLAASGTAGSGARIRIRGSNSMSLSNDPLLIIDGVRAESGGGAFLDVGGQNISRLEDLNPENIETIEVLKGPSASALYGTAAANGVIVITTKKGRAGETRFHAYTEQGTVSDATDYPANFNGYCSIPGVADSFSYCDIGTLSNPDLVALGIKQDSIASFNPLEDSRSTPFETGRSQKYGVNVSGGSNLATYFVSADFEDENGLYKYDLNDLERKNFRANLRGQLTDELGLTLTSGYINSEFRLPQNDNNALGVVSGALLSSEQRFDPETAGYGFGITPEQIANIDTKSAVERILGSASAEYTPLAWLSFNGTAGFDRVNSFITETVLPGEVPYSPTYLEGYRENDRVQNSHYTANANATASYDLMEGTTGNTSIGMQYNEEILRSTSAFGAVLLAGVPSLDGANARFSVDEDNNQVRTVGAYVQQQV
ncbi:MAG TPA: TonB-dependent receptor plug domain-containing protein, partial [Longimicrobiaceae bacterium]|nr:TonB-dependent receptor plug domain-containing protein [Longimicrobiaceae bacterium]